MSCFHDYNSHQKYARKYEVQMGKSHKITQNVHFCFFFPELKEKEKDFSFFCYKSMSNYKFRTFTIKKKDFKNLPEIDSSDSRTALND